MELQSEGTQPSLQMQSMSFARVDALVNALALEREPAKAKGWAEVWTKGWKKSAGWAAWPGGGVDARAFPRSPKRPPPPQRPPPTPAQAARMARKEALALAGTEVERQACANRVTYDEVLADSKLMDIIYSIKREHRHTLACDLWSHPEHWWLIQIIAPITRLPQELLEQILLIIIDEANDSPLALIRVSKLWNTIISGMWASLKLETTTPRDAVTRKLERNQSLQTERT